MSDNSTVLQDAAVSKLPDKSCRRCGDISVFLVHYIDLTKMFLANGTFQFFFDVIEKALKKNILETKVCALHFRREDSRNY